MLKHFRIEIMRRPMAIYLGIYEDDMAIGSFFLNSEDEDLIPYVRECIERFNQKYLPETPQTTTDGNPHPSQHPVKSHPPKSRPTDTYQIMDSIKHGSDSRPST